MDVKPQKNKTMHNLHFVVTKAENPQDACDNVETLISGFGNENNWYTVCGCVSEKNKVYNCGDGRFSPKDTGYTTIARIKRIVNSWMRNSFNGETARKKITNAKKKINLSTWSSSELYSLQCFAKHLCEILPYKDKKFDVLKDSFYSWHFDECGVTQDTDDNEGQIYVVFVDMHS